nr:hypothetical protein CFP56_60609 [Quercus suber]
MLSGGLAVLGIDDCGSAKTGKTVAARNMEEWRLLVSGLGIGSGRRPQWQWSRVQMVVTGLRGVASFFVGLGIKNSCGQRGYIRITGASLGLFKISWGKNLKGTVIFGWLALLMVLLSSGCLRLCCMD